MHEIKARELEFATDNGPVMYIGNALFEDDVTVATKVDRCTKNDARFMSDKFTSITILVKVGVDGSN